MNSKLICKNLFNCQICLIIIITISFSYNYLVFPITIKNKLNQIYEENINSASSYIEYINNNQISTNIFIGTPPKKIEIYLTSERLDFILGKGFCLTNPDSDYNSSLSTSFQKSKVRHFSPFILMVFFLKKISLYIIVYIYLQIYLFKM